MLKKISAGRVESDEGFSIQVSGLETLRYEDHGKIVDIDWTYDPKLRKTNVFVSDVTFWKKPPSLKIDPSDKKKMVKNIGDAVKLLDGNFELV